MTAFNILLRNLCQSKQYFTTFQGFQPLWELTFQSWHVYSFPSPLYIATYYNSICMNPLLVQVNTTHDFHMFEKERYTSLLTVWMKGILHQAPTATLSLWPFRTGCHSNETKCMYCSFSQKYQETGMLKFTTDNFGSQLSTMCINIRSLVNIASRNGS